MSDYASESGHWYERTGEPRYTILGKNGKERDTTLRDARELGLLPSVTTIMASAAKFQLESWKQEQAALAALTTSRRDGESDVEFVKRIIADSQEQAKKAAQRGTEIHAAIESYYGGDLEAPAIEPNWPWVTSIRDLIMQQFGNLDWRPEKSFASPLGYGGKVDLHSDSVLIDFKGKERPIVRGVKEWNWKIYDEHAMQLAAYALGLYGCEHENVVWPQAGIIFFDRNEPYAEYHEVKAAELERGWQMFRSLLDYWYAKTGLQR